MLIELDNLADCYTIYLDYLNRQVRYALNVQEAINLFVGAALFAFQDVRYWVKWQTYERLQGMIDESEGVWYNKNEGAG